MIFELFLNRMLLIILMVFTYFTLILKEDFEIYYDFKENAVNLIKEAQ
ncbi:hypothetical protein [uncultured Methanobrevibacter sp.]|nr:hypothetical protein [uncultured Methanobrevibacter sp.]